MADIEITGTTKLGGVFGKSAQVYGDRPGETNVYIGTSNSDGTFTLYFMTSGAGTYKAYTKNQNGLKGPEYSLYFDAGPFEWNVGDITIYGFKLIGTAKYNGIEGIFGRPILFKPPGGSFSTLGDSSTGGTFSFYIEPSQTGTCEVKSKNPYNEESSVYSFSFTTGSSQWSLGTLNVPILRINLGGTVYVSKEWGEDRDNVEIQVSVTDTCRTDLGTSNGDSRNTDSYDQHTPTEHPLYWQFDFSGSALYMPLSRLNTTLYAYSRDHRCPPDELPISNIFSFSSSTNEYSSQVSFKNPPDLQI